MKVAPRRTTADDSRRRPMNVRVGALSFSQLRRGAMVTGAAAASLRLVTEVAMGCLTSQGSEVNHASLRGTVGPGGNRAAGVGRSALTRVGYRGRCDRGTPPVRAASAL